jgi:hypothetical protein
MNRTLKQLAKEAYDVQDACNLSGVALSFGKALSDLRDLRPANEGTDWLNTHPIAILWADKIASLTGIQTIGDQRVFDAYDKVRAILKETA